MAQEATAVQHHALLKAKVRVAGNLKDDAALDAARGVDVVFDVTGNRDSMGGAVEYLAHGGRMVFVGLVQDDFAIRQVGSARLTVNQKQIVSRAVDPVESKVEIHQILDAIVLYRGTG